MPRQDKHYSVDVQRIVDLTRSLVQGKKYWEQHWEDVAQRIQDEIPKHDELQKALKAVKTWMRGTG